MHVEEKNRKMKLEKKWGIGKTSTIQHKNNQGLWNFKYLKSDAKNILKYSGKFPRNGRRTGPADKNGVSF